MSTEHLIIFGIVNVFSAILSGISGGGGGFITTPLAIFLGLTPQQAIASGKLGGFAISVGSLHGFYKAKIHNWSTVIPVIAIAAIVGLFAPFIIKNIDNDAYRKLLGIVLIAMLPVLFRSRKKGVRPEPSPHKKAIGYVLIFITMGLQAVFSSGIGLLVNLALMTFMGLGILEANITKRFAHLALNGLVIIGVLFSGLIVWKVAIVNMVGSYVGGRIGAKIALKRGEELVTWIFAAFMVASGLALLFG